MYRYIEAGSFTPVKSRVIDLIVLHTMEAAEKGDTAERVATYFKRKDVKASAHYCVDAGTVVQCVQDRDIAWAAPGANHNGIQIEHAGFARQTAGEWGDSYSTATMRRSAAIAAQLSRKHGIPLVFRTAADLRAGGSRARGVTTHYEVSKAYRRSDHWDPGPHFPINLYLSMAREVIDPKGAAMAKVQNAQDAALIPGWKAPDGRPGVWVLQPDGGVFTFPEGAPFFGSMGGKHLNAPMTGIVAYRSEDGQYGYWLIAQDGGIFAFGAAPPVAPYTKFFDEYRIGTHRMVDAEFDGTTLVCLADDGAFYHYRVK